MSKFAKIKMWLSSQAVHSKMCTQNKSSQLDCDILFLWYEIEKILRAVYPKR